MRVLASLALVSLLATGCSIDLGTSTNGEKGRAQFSYSATCFLGCAIDHPVMSGAAARITISGKGLPEVEAVSGNPGVATVRTDHTYSCCKSDASSSECSTAKKGDTCPSGFSMEVSQSMKVEGLRAGFTRIALIDDAGKTIDALQLEVAEPVSATLRSGSSSVDKLELAVGAGATLQAEVHDSTGRKLEGSDGLRYVTADAKIASFDDPAWFFADPAGLSSIERTNWLSTTMIRGRKAGTTTLHIKTATFDQSFAVTVK